MIDKPKTILPSIPAKRYFTIGEVSDLCMVKPHVLRYWEQEFTQLRPMKRRGNRRYYQHHEVLLVRRIRDLLYEQGFTISGARNQLGDRIADPDADLAAIESPIRRLRERHDDVQDAVPTVSMTNGMGLESDSLQSLAGAQNELIMENMPLDVYKARELLKEALRFLS
jgi:DNA-binding transcriptional MerR regulator